VSQVPASIPLPPRSIEKNTTQHREAAVKRLQTFA
jgi:hypothetical protein